MFAEALVRTIKRFLFLSCFLSLSPACFCVLFSADLASLRIRRDKLRKESSLAEGEIPASYSVLCKALKLYYKALSYSAVLPSPLPERGRRVANHNLKTIDSECLSFFLSLALSPKSIMVTSQDYVCCSSRISLPCLYSPELDHERLLHCLSDSASLHGFFFEGFLRAEVLRGSGGLSTSFKEISIN